MMPRELPLLMKPELIKATVEGRKTLTSGLGGLAEVNRMPDRYLEAKQHETDKQCWLLFNDDAYEFIAVKPRYQIGDLCWIREKLIQVFDYYAFYADKTAVAPAMKWRWKKHWLSPIHMPKEAARVWVKVTKVVLTRLQDMTLDEIRAEGLTFAKDCDGSIMRTEFKCLWDRINPKHPFSGNYWRFGYWYELVEK